MSEAAPPLHLFQAFGVELEYMIVDARTLDVRPITDRILRAVNGEVTSDVEVGVITWSNELTAHVIELKTTEPATVFSSLPAAFNDSVHRINATLAPFGGRLMPAAMHPWMDPHREMVLWPHDSSEIYEAFHKIFDCRGHGWANLQAVHLNLPFAGDEEFAKLHTAVRMILPLLPALAASSPIVDGHRSPTLDTRLEVYRENCRRIPSATGLVVPEPVSSQAEYEERILQPLYRDIAPFDPAGVLQHEWLNARGAIARFERSTIEIRVLDVQECPLADVAICALIADVLELLTGGQLADVRQLQSFPTQPLYEVLRATIRDADRAVIKDPEYLKSLGIADGGAVDAGAVWRHLAGCVGPSARSREPGLRPALRMILEQGPLARRILAGLGSDISRQRIEAVYRGLCESLAAGKMFVGLEWCDHPGSRSVST
jgi:glutamate---cysteine ligase / carboxylate-amine ligase